MSAPGKAVAHRKAHRPRVQLGLEDPERAEHIRKMADRIATQFQPLQITLFGSFARGDQHPDSDVDLLVVLPEVEDKHKAASDIGCAVADIPLATDIVVTPQRKSETEET